MGTLSTSMAIDYDLLIAYGGFARKLDKGDIIFREGDAPYFYFQVLEGEVKLFSTNTEGKDLIQGMFKTGQSFGEPPLLLGKPYPATAQAHTACIIVKVSRERFVNILKDYPDLTGKFMYSFAKRVYDKATAAQIWINQTPEDKIKCFFTKLKNDLEDPSPILVPYTRQQIADFTGLRVETVIRTLIRMNKENKVKITDHKVYII